VSGGVALEERAVLAEATRRAGGLDDFGDPAFREPLRRLLHALDAEAGLHAAGRAAQFERTVGLLVERLRTQEAIRRHPEILDERIGDPIVIVGLMRTGTTMLHRMTASDPRLFALLWYEARHPAPFPGADPVGPDPRIADAEREVEAMLGASPELTAVHPMDAHAPDEEILLLEHSFLSTNPYAFCSIPGWARWRERQDPMPAYRLLERFLRFLQWQKRRRGERALRWILKTPFHLMHMDALLATFPGARVVWTHRDPVQSVPSFASLIQTLRETGSDRVDPIEVGRQWCELFAGAIERSLDVRAANETRFLDVDYRALVADPLAQVARIYAFAGLPLPDEVCARMRRWAEENARDKRPVHRYALERFGYTEAGLRRDFARYRARFGLE
jgi:hypothetical protein